MILVAEDDDEYEAFLRQLTVINSMRPMRPIVEDTPWVQTRMPRPEYL